MTSLWHDDLERAAVESRLRQAIVGSNATVQSGLEKLVADTGADEVIVVTSTRPRMTAVVSAVAEERDTTPSAELNSPLSMFASSTSSSAECCSIRM
jgi:hypothetical protein